jgi:hypothetical protein
MGITVLALIGLVVLAVIIAVVVTIVIVASGRGRDERDH